MTQHQREALFWIRSIVYEAYYLIHAVSERETTQPLTTSQVLAKINHRLEHSEDPTQTDQRDGPNHSRPAVS
jgi:hypothetical protein